MVSTQDFVKILRRTNGNKQASFFLLTLQSSVYSIKETLRSMVTQCRLVGWGEVGGGGLVAEPAGLG